MNGENRPCGVVGFRNRCSGTQFSPGKLRELWKYHHLGHGAGNDDAEAAGWPLSLVAGLRHGPVDALQSGDKLLEEC